MVFTEQEISTLALFALCRDVPVSAIGFIPDETVRVLEKFRYIRQSRNGVSVRATAEGHRLLQMAGRDFPSDGQYRCSGSVLERRLNSSRWIFWLNANGVKKFLQKPTLTEGLSFLPSFMLRREKGKNILGGSRFIGILYTEKIAFTCYYVSDNFDGIYADSEQRTFSSEFLTCRKKPKTVITGKADFEELIFVSRCSKATASTAETYFSAAQKFTCETCFVPMSDIGFRQLKVLSIPNYKKRILDAVLTGDYEICRTAVCDALQKSTGDKYIISIDGNIPRLMQRAGEEIHAVMLAEHAKTAGRLLRGSKVIIHPVELNVIEQVLRITKPYPLPDRPFMTKEGDYIYAPIIKTDRKSRK